MSALHLSPDALTSSPGIARLSQCIGAFLTMGLPSLVFGYIVNNHKPAQYLRFTRRISGKQVFLVIVIVFAAVLLGGALARVNQQLPVPANWAQAFKKLEDNYNKDIMVIAGMRNIQDYIVSLLLLAFLPAMMEEMLFRGCVQQVAVGLVRKPWLGILITGVLFSAIHISFYGFLPRLMLGMVLGYLYYYGNNIWLNIWAHFFNNAMALTSVYSLSRSGKLTPDSVNDSMNDTFPLYIGLLGLMVTVSLLIRFKTESERVAQLYPNDQEPFNHTNP
ncbi:abortive infection protein [Filimonas lacunae]|nr:abortive infection protein [Filimonas lacunae]